MLPHLLMCSRISHTEALTQMLPHLLMSNRISHTEALTQMLPHLLMSSRISHTEAVADLRGAQGMHAPMGAQILSISCSFWENMAKSYVGAPLWSWYPLLVEILDPPLRSTYTDASTPLLYTRPDTEALTQRRPHLHCIQVHIPKHLPRCFHIYTVFKYTYLTTYPDASTPTLYSSAHTEALTQMLPHLLMSSRISHTERKARLTQVDSVFMASLDMIIHERALVVTPTISSMGGATYKYKD